MLHKKGAEKVFNAAITNSSRHYESLCTCAHVAGMIIDEAINHGLGHIILVVRVLALRESINELFRESLVNLKAMGHYYI